MAKVKTAKDKITAFLKAKGLDADEIKDAFAELDSADVDLVNLASSVTETKSKNEQWNQWYQSVAPEIKNTMDERDALKAQLAKLQSAGVRFEDDNVTPAAAQNAQPVNIQAELNKFKQDIASASSAVMKDLSRISLRHYNKFKSEADLDAIEKLMQEGKASNINDAYRIWAEPMYEKDRDEDVQRRIAEGVKSGVQAEISKMGIVRTRKRTDDIEAAPLDKPAPSDRELREAFINDINAEVTH